MDKDLQIYVDTYFTGNFNKEDTNNQDTARSRHDHIVMYKNCPISRKLELQIEMCLSFAESEYNGLSYVLRVVVLINKFHTAMITSDKVNSKRE